MVTVLTHVIVYRSLLLFVHQVRHFFDTGLKLLTSCKMGFFNFIPLMQQIFLVCCCHLVVCFVLVFQTTSKSIFTIFLRKIWFFKFFQMVLRFCPGVYLPSDILVQKLKQNGNFKREFVCPALADINYWWKIEEDWSKNKLMESRQWRKMPRWKNYQVLCRQGK